VWIHFEELYDRAMKNRSTAATAMNQGSSRSHAVLMLKVLHADGVHCGKLHLIDLAGSEDNRSTGNSGARIVESSNINKSLFNLGKVIDSLNDAKKQCDSKSSSTVHVPYRDSKLTRLLQDSLGGGNRATMVINLPPGLLFFHHVCNTLSFAAKSRQVVNRPVVNTVPKEQKKVETMEEKLARFKAEKAEKEGRRRSDSSNPRTPTPAIPKSSKKRKPVVPAFGDKENLENARDDGENVEQRAKKLLKDACHDGEADVMGLGDKKYLLTPGAQLKQAKRQVSLAQGFERDNCMHAALTHYEDAYALVPTSRLEIKIAQLKVLVGDGAMQDDMFSAAPPEPLQQIKIDVRSQLEEQLLAALNSGRIERMGQLKDIGAKRMERVQEYLSEGHCFESVSDLKNIGMSEKQAENFVKKNAMHCLV